LHARGANGGGEASAAVGEFLVGVVAGVVGDGGFGGENTLRPAEEGERGERNVVGLGLGEVVLENAGGFGGDRSTIHVLSPSNQTSPTVVVAR